VPLNKIVAYVNADMVGRLRDNKLTVQGVGSSHAWRRLLEKRNIPAGFSLALQDDPYLPTDVTSLYLKSIPALNFFTGAHEDYHRPTDTADKLNYERLERVTKFAEQIVIDLAQAQSVLIWRVERRGRVRGRERNTQRYLGTIPDYTAVRKLSGGAGASPAEESRAVRRRKSAIVECRPENHRGNLRLHIRARRRREDPGSR
jgi:hypothetical protein